MDLSEGVPVLAFIKDSKGEIAFASGPLCAMSRRHPQEMPGHPAGETFPSDLAALLDLHDHEVLDGSIPSLMAEAWLDVSGERAPYTVRKAPLRAGDGSIVGLAGVVTGQSWAPLATEPSRSLLELSRSLGRTADLEETLEGCVGLATRLSGMDAGGMLLLDPDPLSNDLVLIGGAPFGAFATVLSILLSTDQLRSLGADAWMYLHPEGLPKNLGDALSRGGIKTLALMPLNHEGTTVAVLVLASRTLEAIPSRALDALVLLGEQVGTHIGRVRAEALLHESERRFRTLIDTAPVGILMADAEGRILEANEELARMTGFPRGELVGRSLADLGPPPAEGPNWTQLMELARGAGGSPNCELAIRSESGTPVHVEVGASALDDIKGDHAQCIVVLRDISRRKRSEDALRESEERFRHLVEVSFDGYVIHDGNRIIDANGRFPRLFGYEPSEIVGMLPTDLTVPEHRDIVSRAILERDERPYEALGLRKDGTTFNMEIVGGEVLYQGRKARIAAVRDINERKLIERKHAEERNRAELFLDVFGHDINNLNQGVVGYLELFAAKMELPEPVKRYHQGALKQALAISMLVSRVQELSRLIERDLAIEDIDVAKVLEGAVDRVQESHPGRAVRVVTDLRRGSAFARGHDLLLDVFFNILDNAVKYDPHEEVVVDVACLPADGGRSLRMEFRDRGRGVPEAMKGRIFRRFERGESGVHGSGLGLTIVSEIVRRLDGRVWVEDRVDGDPAQGCCVVLVLPRANPDDVGDTG